MGAAVKGTVPKIAKIGGGQRAKNHGDTEYTELHRKKGVRSEERGARSEKNLTAADTEEKRRNPTARTAIENAKGAKRYAFSLR
ncbi:MAG TPA: hypothetical protein VF646_05730, partial [Cytophagales bacterium]